MTTWTVERNLYGRGYDLARWDDGHRVTVRARFEGLSCIMARVLAAELNDAYARGREDMQWEMFTTTLADR